VVVLPRLVSTRRVGNMPSSGAAAASAAGEARSLFCTAAGSSRGAPAGTARVPVRWFLAQAVGVCVCGGGVTTITGTGGTTGTVTVSVVT
jgi:hypothetical protein